MTLMLGYVTSKTRCGAKALTELFPIRDPNLFHLCQRFRGATPGWTAGCVLCVRLSALLRTDTCHNFITGHL